MPIIFNGIPRYDQNSNVVNSSGGCLIKDGNYFYLFGEYRLENSVQFAGFTRYRSEDLEHWTYMGLAVKKQKDGLLGPHRIGERPKVVRTVNGQYVMMMHTDDERTFDPCVGYAIADGLDEPFVFKGPLLFNGEPIKMWHIGSFTDDDGTNYLLTHEGDIYRLSADGHFAEEKIISNIAPGTEAPAMFKENGHYFLLVSQKTSWERNDNYYYCADSLIGPWEYRGPFCPSGTLTHNSQSSFVFKLHSNKGDFPMYIGDRRSYPFLDCTTSIWLPIKVTGTKLNISEFWSSWNWFNEEEVKLKKEKLAWLGKMKNDSMTVKFEGTDIRVFGRTDSHSGYALLTLFDSDNTVVHEVTIDFYSQVTNDGLRYVSPKLSVGEYRLQIKVLGKHGEWYDKSHRLYGSTDDDINVTGYYVNDNKKHNGQVKISYNSVGFPFAISEMGQSWNQQSVAKPNGVPYYYWLQSDAGVGQITLSNRQVQLRAGQGILVEPNVSFTWHAESSVWQTSYLIFSGAKVREMLSLAKDQRVLYIPVLSAELFAYIRKYNIKFRRNYTSNLEASKLVEKFVSMLKPYTNSKLEVNKQKIAKSVLDIIYNKFDSPLTNTSLAGMTNYSVQYVLQTFSDVYNTTPRRALAMYRIAETKLLLIRYPTMALRQVAQRCGFSSEAYMIRIFKSTEGLTPGQFRLLATRLLLDK